MQQPEIVMTGPLRTTSSIVSETAITQSKIFDEHSARAQGGKGKKGRISTKGTKGDKSSKSVVGPKTSKLMFDNVKTSVTSNSNLKIVQIAVLLIMTTVTAIAIVTWRQCFRRHENDSQIYTEFMENPVLYPSSYSPLREPRFSVLSTPTRCPQARTPDERDHLLTFESSEGRILSLSRTQFSTQFTTIPTITFGAAIESNDRHEITPSILI